MLKAILAELKSEARPAKLIALSVLVIGVLWVLVLLKKNAIAKQINPLEA